MQQLVSLYYAKPKERESDCQNFTLSVDLIEGTLMSFISSFYFTYLYVFYQISLLQFMAFYLFVLTFSFSLFFQKNPMPMKRYTSLL